MSKRKMLKKKTSDEKMLNGTILERKLSGERCQWVNDVWRKGVEKKVSESKEPTKQETRSQMKEFIKMRSESMCFGEKRGG